MEKFLMKKVLIFSFLLVGGMAAVYGQASGESSGGTGISFEMSVIPNIKYAGLGFSVFGNMNAREPVIGAGITAAIGKFYHGGSRRLIR